MSMTHLNGGSKVDVPPPGFSLEKNGNARIDTNVDKSPQRLLNPLDLTHEPLDDAMKNQGRTKSFVKLAAVFGEGLAESMDVSVLDDQKQKSMSRYELVFELSERFNDLCFIFILIFFFCAVPYLEMTRI